MLSKKSLCVKKYKTKIGKIEITHAAIKRLKLGPTSLIKPYIDTVTGNHLSSVNINNGHAKAFQASINEKRLTVTMIGRLNGIITLYRK